MNSPRIIMNFIYYPDGMAIICFNFNTNCHEFPTNYHEFYLLSRWRTQNKNNYMEIRGQLHDNYMFYLEQST